MSKLKRYAAISMAILLLLLSAASASAATGINQQGRSAAELDESLFIVINNNSGAPLNLVPASGGDLTRVDTQTSISDLITVNDRVYYLRYDPPGHQLVSTDAQGQALDILAEFEGASVEKLSYYDGMFYCLVENLLTLIDPTTGENDPLNTEVLMTDYAIINDVIYYVSKSDTQTYEMIANGATVSGTAGLLYSMSITGTNSEKILDQGVTDLQPGGNYLYLHNMADSYPTESADGLVWLEGKLYRMDVANNQLHSMNLPYDWVSIPTDYGVLVYTSQNISLYPHEGGLSRQLMIPEAYTTLSATNDTAYVYEHTKGQLTAIPLTEDGEATVLYSGGPIKELLPSTAKSTEETSNTSLIEEVIIDDEDDSTTDTTDSSESSGTDSDTPSTSSGSSGSPDYSGNTDPGYYDYDEVDSSSSSGSSGSGSSGSGSSGSASSDEPDEDDDYIFSLSSKRRLSRNKVLSVSKSKWGYARNEIFARHGYIFGDGKYGKYFRSKDWYTPGGYADSKLNDIEWANVELIRKMEVEFGLIKDTQKKEVVPASPKATPKPTKTSTSSSGSSSTSTKKRVTLSKNVFENSSTKKLTPSQLSGLSASKLAVARNEILARHGYPFQQSKWKKYFTGTGWKSRSSFSYGDLNSIESYNIELIKKYE